MQEIKGKVRSFVLDNFMMGTGADSLQDGDSFMGKHIIDSTGFLELITFLEESFGFVVEENEMIPENLDSLNNVAAYVQRKAVA